MTSSVNFSEEVTLSSEVVDNEEKENTSTSKLTTPAQPTMKQTVIRLKRRIEDSPSRILVVSYKKRRTEFGVQADDYVDDSPSTSAATVDDKELMSNPRFSKILRLVGTVPGEEADNGNIAVAVKNIIGDGLVSGANSRTTQEKVIPRKTVKAKTSNIAEKVREQQKKDTEERRFKIIASKRGITDSQENEQPYDADLLQLLDLVPESDDKEPRKKEKPEGFEVGNVTCNGKPMVKEMRSPENGFVYDLYLFNDPCIEDFMCGQALSVEMGDEELDFGEYREKDEDFVQDDDDDSNAEDNWRNDYPDSDEEGLHEDGYNYGAGGDGYHSDESDVYKTFKAMRVKYDDGSSSDDDLVYGIDADNDGDGTSFNENYSRYKSRVMQEYADEVVSVSSDSD